MSEVETAAKAPRGLSVGRKLLLGVLSAAALAALSVGVVGYQIAAGIKTADVKESLKEGALTRVESLDRYVAMVESDLRHFALGAAGRDLQDFARVYAETARQGGAEALRRSYIEDNPNPLGSKHLLDRGAAAPAYDALHAARHGVYRRFLLGRGYYDIFLISNAGDIVYSVFKEQDFATNLSSGAYADSGLGEAFREASKLNSAERYTFVDFKPYAPSNDAPAAFVASPVFSESGERVGVYAVQIPIDRVADAIKSHGVVESYLVGADGRLRSDLKATEEIDVLTRQIDQVIVAEASPVHAVVVESQGALDRPSVLAMQKVSFFGADYTLVEEEAVADMMAPIMDLRLTMLSIVAPILALCGALAYFIGRSLSRPLTRLRDAAEHLAAGEIVEIPGVDRSDEIGHLACAMNQINQASAASQRVKTALDNASAPMMVADKDFRITYVNPALQKSVADASHYFSKLGLATDALVGVDIDIFHNRPEETRRRLADMTQPHRAEIELDEQIFSLNISPIDCSENGRLGYVVEWRDVSDVRRAEREIQKTIAAVATGDLGRRPTVDVQDPIIAKSVDGLREVCEIMDGFVSDVTASLGALSQGDLSRKMRADYAGVYGDVAQAMNETIGQLSALVSDILTAEGSMRGSISAVEGGATDLASRAENQASSLEETAATMEEIAATINANAENSGAAMELASETQKKAQQGEAVVADAVAAMAGIEESSAKISDIITVIDGIAFQTNLLALNAAVEAARAGDAGKGFAVVASEVRTLAQRSADAARDITDLISVSTSKVSEGVRLVRETGSSLDAIRGSIYQVSESVESIASASREQATGVQEITSAVSHMDEMTQKNASLAEQSASAAKDLASRSRTLAQLMGFFKGAQAGAAAALPQETAADASWAAQELAEHAPRRDAVETEAASAPAPQKRAAGEESWAEF